MTHCQLVSVSFCFYGRCGLPQLSFSLFVDSKLKAFEKVVLNLEVCLHSKCRGKDGEDGNKYPNVQKAPSKCIFYSVHAEK